MDFVPLKSLNNQFGINEKSEIINFKTGRIIHPYIRTDMYQHVTLFLNGKKIRKRVHRLMAEAFLNNCKVVDHIDGNKSNNLLTNLRSVTHSVNIQKAYKENISLKEACVALGFLTAEKFDEVFRPEDMARIKK